MPLPRPRFTVRRMMIAVAVAAVLFGAGVESKRRQVRFRRLCNLYEGKANLFYETPERHLFGPARGGFVDMNNRNEEIGDEAYAERRAYYEAMYLKYSKASRYPWIPVAPDPPKPVWARRGKG